MKLNKIFALAILALGLSTAAIAETYRISRGNPNQIPMNYLDEKGHPIGFEKDLLDEIIKRTGLDIKEEFSKNVPSALDKLNKHEVDMVMDMLSITPERQELFMFSESYFNANPVSLITKDESIKELSDLAGKTIAIEIGSLHQELAEKIKAEHPETKILVKDSSFLAVKDVLQDKADVALGDDTYMQSYVARYKEHHIVLAVDNHFEKDNYGIVFAKDVDKQLISKVNGALHDIHKDGTYQKLLDKWFKSN